VALERTPPEDRLHRKLWGMGFDQTERERIIRVAMAHFPYGDPVALGNFIACGRLKTTLDRLKAMNDGP